MPVKHTWQSGFNRETGKSEFTTATINLGKAVREFCKSCYAFVNVNENIKDCPSKTCSLYPFRFGKDPGRTKTLTDEEKKKLSDRFAETRKKMRPRKKNP